MSLRPRASTRSHLDDVLLAGLFKRALDISGTGKLKADGSKAETRLGKPVSDRWLNERFRQVMELVLEFRLAWPSRSLLSHHDVAFIEAALDVALGERLRSSTSGHQYDMSPTVWAIWLLQYTYQSRNGGWAVESAQEQAVLSFESLYGWLAQRHALGELKVITNTVTGKTHRYKLPFKKMNVPPKPEDAFRWRKGGRELSALMEAGGLPPLADGIVQGEPPVLRSSQLPTVRAAWVAQAAALRSSAAHVSKQRGLRSSVAGDGDAELTRDVVQTILNTSDTQNQEMRTVLGSETQASQGRDTSNGGAGPSGESDDVPPEEGLVDGAPFMTDDEVVALLAEHEAEAERVRT